MSSGSPGGGRDAIRSHGGAFVAGSVALLAAAVVWNLLGWPGLGVYRAFTPRDWTTQEDSNAANVGYLLVFAAAVAAAGWAFVAVIRPRRPRYRLSAVDADLDVFEDDEDRDQSFIGRPSAGDAVCAHAHVEVSACEDQADRHIGG